MDLMVFMLVHLGYQSFSLLLYTLLEFTSWFLNFRISIVIYFFEWSCQRCLFGVIDNGISVSFTFQFLLLGFLFRMISFWRVYPMVEQWHRFLFLFLFGVARILILINILYLIFPWTPKRWLVFYDVGFSFVSFYLYSSIFPWVWRTDCQVFCL